MEELVAILREARALVAKPENDFSWSSWLDTAHALAELDSLIATAERGELPSDFIFVATGPMQELSLSSGWGDEFCAIADRFEAAVAKLAS